MWLPDLLILGCPKCGTSSLHNWLAAHPAMLEAERKELFYLMDLGHPLRSANANLGNQGYRAMWPEDVGGRQVFEGTTHYFYSDAARQAVASAECPPKLVVVLRDPVRRLESSYRFTQNNLARVKGGMSFADFVEALLAGRGEAWTAEHVEHDGSRFVLARDLDYGCYLRYLDAWAEAVPDSPVRVVIMEEMVTDPAGTVRGLAGWLGIDPSFYDGFSFAARNETFSVGSRGVHRWAVKINAMLQGLPGRQFVRDAYRRMNSGQRREDPRDEQARARLREFYAEWNQRLAERLGRSLEVWT